MTLRFDRVEPSGDANTAGNTLGLRYPHNQADIVGVHAQSKLARWP